MAGAGSWALEGGTNGRMENLPILQDFVLYWGLSPKTQIGASGWEEQGVGKQ